MSFFSRPEVISVTSNNDYLLWEIPVSNINSRQVILQVSEGCQAIFYLDGIAHTYNPGRHNLEWRKVVAGHMVSAVGVNLQKRFTLKFGAGGIAFNDWEIEETPRVGMYGECEITVLDAASIHNVFGNSVKNIKISDIKDKLDIKFKEFINTELSKTLKKYDYTTIDSALVSLSAKLKEQFSNEFLRDGVSVIRCSIGGIHFPDGYDEHRQDVINEKKLARKQANARKKELEFIDKVSEIPVPDTSTNKTATTTNSSIFCPRCGKENPAGTNYCKNCGIKLN